MKWCMQVRVDHYNELYGDRDHQFSVPLQILHENNFYSQKLKRQDNFILAAIT